MHVELEVPTTRLHTFHLFTRSRTCDEFDATVYPHARVQVSVFVGALQIQYRSLRARDHGHQETSHWWKKVGERPTLY